MEDIVKDMWVTHGMRRAMCQATKRELRVSGGRYFGKYLVWEARIRKEESMGKKGKDPVGFGGGEKRKREKEIEK